MKFRTFGTLMLLVAMAAIMMLGLTEKVLASSLSTEKQAIPIFMKMFEKQSALLMMNSKSGKPSIPMTKQQLADTVKWLKGLKFSQFPSPIKQDFEVYRQQLLTTCAKPPKGGGGYSSGYEIGTAWSGLNRKSLTLIVDFDLDEAKAKKYGYAQLADQVNLETLIGYAAMASNANLSVGKLKEMEPSTKIFIDLFAMFNFLAGSESRNALLQGSVYSVHPEKIKDATQRKALTDAKKKLLDLSHHISANEDQKLPCIAMAIISLCDAHKVCRIADADLKKAGGDALYKQVHGMIRTRNGKQ